MKKKNRKKQEEYIPTCPVYLWFNKYGRENIIAFSDLCNYCIPSGCKYFREKKS